jgi:hypothetical protein
VHAVLVAGLRVVGVEGVWILVRRVISCSLVSVQEPLQSISLQYAFQGGAIILGGIREVGGLY